MNSKISAFPSKELYESNLIDHDSVKDRTLEGLLTESSHSPPKEDEILKEPVVFIDTDGCDYFEKSENDGNGIDEGSKSNENEAHVVAKWVNRLVSCSLDVCPSAFLIRLDRCGYRSSTDGDYHTVNDFANFSWRWC